MKTEMLFKLSNLNSNLALTLGYLNPALNNSAQILKQSQFLPYLSYRYTSLGDLYFDSLMFPCKR